MGCDTEVLSPIRPRFGSEISLIVGDESISLGDGRSHRFPGPIVMRRPVDEDGWFAGALLDVLQADAVDLNLPGSLAAGGEVR